MFSLYSSHSRPLYHSPPIYSVYPNDELFPPYPSYPHSRPPINGPAVRYRRALGGYLAAAEEHNALLGARREAKLMAHAEALRRERASLRLAQLSRARKEQQFEQGLAKALARAAVSEDNDPSLHHVVPVAVMYRTSEEPLSDSPRPHAHASCADGASVEKDSVCDVWILFGFDPDHGSGAARCRGDEC